MSENQKPKIENVTFSIPSSQFGILGSKGLSLAASSGEIRGGCIDPKTVGVDRVCVTVDNGFGTSQEIVTVHYVDDLAPVLDPIITITSMQGVEINYQLAGRYTSAGSGDRVRSVSWEAENLPEGISLDLKTGRISGRIMSPQVLESSLVCRTNCGEARSRLCFKVDPLKVEVCGTSSNIVLPDSATFHSSILLSSYFDGNQDVDIWWRVHPAGGVVRPLKNHGFLVQRNYFYYYDVSYLNGRGYVSSSESNPTTNLMEIWIVPDRIEPAEDGTAIVHAKVTTKNLIEPDPSAETTGYSRHQVYPFEYGFASAYVRLDGYLWFEHPQSKSSGRVRENHSYDRGYTITETGVGYSVVWDSAYPPEDEDSD